MGTEGVLGGKPRLDGTRISVLQIAERVLDLEGVDRSTVVRQLLERGYEDSVTELAARRYRRGDVTIGEAAALADRSRWEMERHLVREGDTSAHSIADRERELLRSEREG